jgi:CubicO group peptidase (beta-lactamase class C family)
MKKLALSITFFAIYLFANSQTWQDTVLKIEKIFERYKATIPGVELAISRNSSVIFSKAWGMADLEHDVPLTTEILFR